MYLHQAVALALKENAMIYRKKIHKETGIIKDYIKPTNSYDTCIIVTFREEREIKSCRHWNPTADDLMADDWEVFKE